LQPILIVVWFDRGCLVPMVMGTDGSQLRDGLGFDHGCVGLEDNDITEAPIARTMALTKIAADFDHGLV
jgi:hypothetical protein